VQASRQHRIEMAWISRSQELPQDGNIPYSPMPDTCGGSDEFESTPLDISLLLEPQTLGTVHPGRQSIPVHWDIKDRNRGQSPENVMQFPEFLISKSASRTSEAEIAESEKRVTIWNWKEKRKLSGNSAPFKRNLQKYLKKHPDWQEYIGQDKETSGKRPTPKKRRNPGSTPTATPTKAATKAATKTPTFEPTSAEFAPEDVETCEPVPLYVRPLEHLTEMRTQQLAAKRKLFEVEEAAHRAAEQERQDIEKERTAEALALVSKEQHQRAEDWKHAQLRAQQVRAEQAVAKQHERVKWHLKDQQQQQLVIAHSLNRVALWKRARLA